MKLPADDRPGDGQGGRGHRASTSTTAWSRSTRSAATRRASASRSARFHRARTRARRDAGPTRSSAPSTHDTKRSEDVRARHQRALGAARGVGRARPPLARAEPPLQARASTASAAPDAQRRVPALPDAGRRLARTGRGRPIETLVERIAAYMHKATKEAKVHTSWMNPDAELRRGAARLRRRGSSRRASTFRAAFRALSARWSRSTGRSTRSPRSLLKIAVARRPRLLPGHRALGPVSLVDPDNRRPVDFAHRRAHARALASASSPRARSGIELGASCPRARGRRDQALRAARGSAACGDASRGLRRGEYLRSTSRGRPRSRRRVRSPSGATR